MHVTETFEDWLQRTKQGSGERRAFWDPFFIPALNAPFDRVSAADAIFVLKRRSCATPSAARFGFSTVPLAHLAAAAASHLDGVHTSTPVLGVSSPAKNPAASLSHFQGRPGRVRRGRARRAAATSSHASSATLRSTACKSRRLRRVSDRRRPSLARRRNDRSRLCRSARIAAAVDLRKGAGLFLLQFQRRRPVLATSHTATRIDGVEEAQAFLPELRDATLMRSAVTRNPEATWLPRIGVTRTSQRTSRSRIAIAGAWTETGWPDTMESAVRSGRLAAEYLIGNDAGEAGGKRSKQSGEAGATHGGGATRGELTPIDAVDQSLKRAIGWLLREQSPEGWWSGELETNVTMTAEHVLLFRFLGLPLDDFRDGAIAHILHHQRGDGSWALYYDGPADLSTTIEAYVALKVLGVDPERDEMRKALGVISPPGRRRRTRASSRRFGWRSSASIRGRASHRCRRRSSIFRCGCRSISTTSRAGHAARSRR